MSGDVRRRRGTDLCLVQERAGALRTWQPCDGGIESRDRKGKEEGDQAIAKNTKRPSVVQVNEKASRECAVERGVWSCKELEEDDANNKQKQMQMQVSLTLELPRQPGRVDGCRQW